MKSNSTVIALLALRGGSETRVLSRNEKDLGKKFPEGTPLPSTRNPHWPFCSKQADNISQRVLTLLSQLAAKMRYFSG
jgi:hypothetical protein